MIYIKRLQITGLKGVGTDVTLSRSTIITGPNGAGKSRISEAISFLLGRPTAGMSVSSKEMRSILHGDTMKVSATLDVDGLDVFVSRSRSLVDGVFKRPKLKIDGAVSKEKDLADLIGGPFSLSGGSDLIGMSERRLTSAISSIVYDKETGDSLKCRVESTFQELGLQLDLGSDSDTLMYDLETAVKAARQTARSSRRAIEEGCDLSRIELGESFNSRSVVAAGNALKSKTEIMDDAREAYGAATGRCKALAVQQLSVSQTIYNLEREVKEKPPECTVTEDEVQAAESECRDLSAKREEAQVALDTSKLIVSQLMDAQYAAEMERRRVQRSIEQKRVRLKWAMDADTFVNVVPCSGCDEWVSAEDPFEKPSAMASSCGLLKDAMFARTKVEPTRIELEDLKVDYAKAEAESASARAAYMDASIVGSTAAERGSLNAILEERRALSKLESMRQGFRKIQAFSKRAGEIAAKTSQLQSAEVEALSLEHEMTQLNADYERAGEAFRSLSSEVDKLRSSYSDEKISAERYRRFQADRKRLDDALIVEDRLTDLVDDVLSTQRLLVARGLTKIKHAGDHYLPNLEIDVRDGRIGVCGAGNVFWSGSGLSAAQRVMLESALDHAMEVITSAPIRITVIEADPVDDVNLGQMMSAIDRDIGDGALSQAIVISWRKIERDDWTAVNVEPQSTGLDVGDGQTETIPEMIEDLDGPTLSRLWKHVLPDSPVARTLRVRRARIIHELSSRPFVESSKIVMDAK